MNKSKYFLLLSFIEGAAVMAAELLGAKMLAPFFGSSLPVWSAVMAITLGGLAVGYFIGGRLSERKNKEIVLYNVLLTAALFTVLMPYTSSLTLRIFGFWPLLPAVTISAFVLLFPPVFLMGAVSPLIISNISKSGANPGKTAGTVYAVSTTGGIISTFLFGFFIIPTFGLTMPSIVIGVVLATLPFILLLRLKQSKSIVHFLVILVFSSLQLYFNSHKNGSNKSVKIVLKEQGILGEIVVLDIVNDEVSIDTDKRSRWLYVNRISQTKDNTLSIDEEGQYFSYVYRFTELLKELPPEKRDVLLLGLGGGSLAKNLVEQGFNVDACELDSRIAKVAEKYFDLPENVHVTIDDARHHIKFLKRKYDIVIFDTFRGEVTPDHLITIESLEEVKKVLNDDGYLLINSFNHILGEKGLGLRSIYKTLSHVGFNTSIWPSGDSIEDRNLLFISTVGGHKKRIDFMDLKAVDFTDAMILSDEYPAFEVLNARAGLAWRKWAIDNYF